MAKKMNPFVKKLWVEHLLSDWYVQNFQIDDQNGIPLRTEDDKWSPFGVLCNIHAQTFPDAAQQETEKTSYQDYEYLIPRHVATWAGLKDRGTCLKFDTPISFDGNKYENLEDMFMDGVPFFMIADVIEEKF
ncbi:MAG: hypothetical protein KGI50_07610 [Patescibacteria group bacterium]|nr:hypothetical protein [Patescibacteria group bacterium]